MLASLIHQHSYGPDSGARRKQTAVVVLIWAILPMALSAMAFVGGDLRSGGSFLGVAFLALVASRFARSARRARQVAAVLALFVAASPFTILFIRGMVLARGGGASMVADSPFAFLIGAVVQSLFFVPLLAFAFSIWRNRSARAV